MCCCPLVKDIQDEGSAVTNSNIPSKSLFQIAQLPKILAFKLKTYLKIQNVHNKEFV